MSTTGRQSWEPASHGLTVHQDWKWQSSMEHKRMEKFWNMLFMMSRVGLHSGALLRLDKLWTESGWWVVTGSERSHFQEKATNCCILYGKHPRSLSSLGEVIINVNQARFLSECSTGTPYWPVSHFLALSHSLLYAPRAWGTGCYCKAYCIRIDKVSFIIVTESCSLFLKL